jgi:hypothetical protein
LKTVWKVAFVARAVGGDTVESQEMWKGSLLTLKGYEERERERERDRQNEKQSGCSERHYI